MHLFCQFVDPKSSYFRLKTYFEYISLLELGMLTQWSEILKSSGVSKKHKKSTAD